MPQSSKLAFGIFLKSLILSSLFFNIVVNIQVVNIQVALYLYKSTIRPCITVVISRLVLLIGTWNL